MTYKELKLKFEEYKNLNLEEQIPEVTERRNELKDEILQYAKLFDTTGKDFAIILENIAKAKGNKEIKISHKCDTIKTFDYDDFHTYYEGSAYINVEIANEAELKLFKNIVTQNLNFKPSYIKGFYPINVLNLYFDIIDNEELYFSSIIEESCATVLKNNIANLQTKRITEIQQKRNLLIERRLELMDANRRLKNIVKLTDEILDLSNQVENLNKNPEDVELDIK